MRLRTVLVSTFIVMSALIGPEAQAGGGGVVCGDCPELSDLEFKDVGRALKVRGELDNLENDDVKITVIAFGEGEASCQNPGGNLPPGQNPADVEDVTLKGFRKYECEEELEFTVQTQSLSGGVVPGAPDCPNDKWTERITDVSFTAVKIIIKNDDNVLKVFCEFDEPTTDGEWLDTSDADCTCDED